MMKKKSGKRASAGKSSSAKKAAPKKVSARPAKLAAPKLAAAKTVDEYFDRLTEPALSALYKMREAIRSCMPAEATEFISYGIPAFKLTRVLVWYAAFTSHCSIFPTSKVIEAFKDELKGFTVTKGTIQFPLNKPVPVALIKKLVKTRVQQDASGVRRRQK